MSSLGYISDNQRPYRCNKLASTLGWTFVPVGSFLVHPSCSDLFPSSLFSIMLSNNLFASSDANPKLRCAPSFRWAPRKYIPFSRRSGVILEQVWYTIERFHNVFGLVDKFLSHQRHRMCERTTPPIWHHSHLETTVAFICELLSFLHGTEAEFNYCWRGLPDFQRVFPNPSWLMSGGTSGHQNPVSIFPWIDNCLLAKFDPLPKTSEWTDWFFWLLAGLITSST